MYVAIDPGVHGAIAAIGVVDWGQMGLGNADFQVIDPKAGIVIADMPVFHTVNPKGRNIPNYDPGLMYEVMMALKDQSTLNGGMKVMVENITRAPKVPKAGQEYARGGFGDFSSGESRGIWRTVMAIGGIPFDWLTAATWRKHYKLKGGHKHKADGIPIAKRLFPEVANSLKRVSIDHNRADALLMANYVKMVVAWDNMGAFR